MEIRKLLVANRGEIAARVFRTCQRLGIETVAVVAPDDRTALHARGASDVRDVAGYLDREELLAAATESGADAVHPGYGFLAENADFAESVGAAGLIWVGPPPAVLRAAGDKLESKRAAERAGVPVIPTGEPDEIGYPLIVKAAAGGGGRGMRVVRSPDGLDDALEAARREAEAAFGDDTVFLERYLERPRHVEVQLLADAQGTVVQLGERDCSIQRRHQKILEESPAFGLDPGLREEMAAAAVALARALEYEGAGTVEFIVAEPGYFFLELNARIQVEHPVTELVTGLDLVEQQLRIAAGETLELGPVASEGHAIEVRLYAEDPRSFLPQTGRIESLRLPKGVRVDAGVEAGDEVPVAYDPMIAKLVAHGEMREEALENLVEALDETAVSGVTTNLPFLRWLVRHPEVRAGRVSTTFLEESPPLSRPVRIPPAWRGGWRLNRSPASLHGPPPTVELSADAGSWHDGQSAVTAPMPGTVIRVLAEEGRRVVPREPLIVLEAMKMETPILSPHEAVVLAVHVAEGDRVAGGSLLVELTDASPARVPREP